MYDYYTIIFIITSEIKKCVNKRGSHTEKCGTSFVAKQTIFTLIKTPRSEVRIFTIVKKTLRSAKKDIRFVWQFLLYHIIVKFATMKY